jgi:hypothetical protein
MCARVELPPLRTPHALAAGRARPLLLPSVRSVTPCAPPPPERRRHIGGSFAQEEEEEEEERSLIVDLKRHTQLAVAWNRHGSPVPRWT